MVWLVSYYEFYDKKVIEYNVKYLNINTVSYSVVSCCQFSCVFTQIRSTVLCDVIGSQEMSTFLQEEGYIHIIKCFLNPVLMIYRPEVPNPLTDHEQVLELHGRGHRPARRKYQERDDPLFRLFHEVKQGIKI